MKGYGQFCPIAKASEVLGERWTSLIIRELGAGSEKFNDIRRGLPLMSPTLLSNRLKMLESRGLVERRTSRGSVSYHLTRAGRELKPVLLQLGQWGHRWVRTDLDNADLDPSLLMWDIRRTMTQEYFRARRTVLKFEFTDYTSHMRNWWLVISGGEVDVCMRDHGYEIDLHLVTDLKTLTAYWIGDISMTRALQEKFIVLSGNTMLKRDIRKWLGRNYFSDIKPEKQTR